MQQMKDEDEWNIELQKDRSLGKTLPIVFQATKIALQTDRKLNGSLLAYRRNISVTLPITSQIPIPYSNPVDQTAQLSQGIRTRRRGKLVEGRKKERKEGRKEGGKEGRKEGRREGRKE